MQRTPKLTWASTFVALLIVGMTTFGGGLLVAMAQGSASSSPYSSCTLVKGKGNTPLTNLQAGGKVSVGLNCQLRASSNGQTKPTGKNATEAVVSSSSAKPTAKPSTQPTAKPSVKGSPRPSASCQLVKGTGNTPLHTTPLLTSLLQAVFKTNQRTTVQLGLNCQVDDGSFPTGIFLRKNGTNCQPRSGNWSSNGVDYYGAADCSGDFSGWMSDGGNGAYDSSDNYSGCFHPNGPTQCGSWHGDD